MSVTISGTCQRPVKIGRSALAHSRYLYMQSVVLISWSQSACIRWISSFHHSASLLLLIDLAFRGTMASTHATTVQDLQQLSNSTGKRWWQDAGLRRLNSYIAVIWLAQIVGGFDGALMGSLIAIPQFRSGRNSEHNHRKAADEHIRHGQPGSVAGRHVAGHHAHWISRWRYSRSYRRRSMGPEAGDALGMCRRDHWCCYLDLAQLRRLPGRSFHPRYRCQSVLDGWSGLDV